MPQKKYDMLCLGEIMLRLSPVGKDRIAYSDIFEKKAGGSEFNIAAAGAALGLKTGFVSKLPDNALGSFIRNKIHMMQVDDTYVIKDKRKEARVGIYFYESGASPRKPSVVYDRRDSSFCTIVSDAFPKTFYEGVSVFHTSGITYALNSIVRNTAKQMMQRFHENGSKISFDVNFRANLWSEEEARQEITEILPLIDILYISEESLRRMFQRTGNLESIMKAFAEEFSLDLIATTQRSAVNSGCHHFKSILYQKTANQFFTGKPYEFVEVVDRIGSGDAYVAGVTYGLLYEKDCQKAVEYGDTMAVLKCTIAGDYIETNKSEIEQIMKEHKSNEIQSEMNR